MHKLPCLVNIERVCIGRFDDSLTSQEELPSTKIGEILRRFQQTGVLPSVGRVAIPCDLVAGGMDFNTLRALIDEARAIGVSDEQLSSLFKSTNNNGGTENGNKSGDGNPAGNQSGVENAGQTPAGDGQNA